MAEQQPPLALLPLTVGRELQPRLEALQAQIPGAQSGWGNSLTLPRYSNDRQAGPTQGSPVLLGRLSSPPVKLVYMSRGAMRLWLCCP